MNWNPLRWDSDSEAQNVQKSVNRVLVDKAFLHFCVWCVYKTYWRQIVCMCQTSGNGVLSWTLKVSAECSRIQSTAFQSGLPCLCQTGRDWRDRGCDENPPFSRDLGTVPWTHECVISCTPSKDSKCQRNCASKGKTFLVFSCQNCFLDSYILTWETSVMAWSMTIVSSVWW